MAAVRSQQKTIFAAAEGGKQISASPSPSSLAATNKGLWESNAMIFSSGVLTRNSEENVTKVSQY
jgi:hypothetical protein